MSQQLSHSKALADLLARFRSKLYMLDTGPIEVVLGSYVGNRLPGDSLYLLLFPVAAPAPALAPRLPPKPAEGGFAVSVSVSTPRSRLTDRSQGRGLCPFPLRQIFLTGRKLKSHNGSQLTRFLVCTGAVDFDEGVERRALLVHLAGSLRKIDARAVTISDESVTFRGGLFRLVSTWNILMPFGSGELVVDAKKHAVRYRLFIHQLVLVVTAMMAFAFASPIVRIDLGRGLIFLTLAWLWLIGGNLLIGLPRFKEFLREAVDSTPVGRSPN